MEELANINWALIAPLIILQFILALVVIVDISCNGATNGPKWLWIIVALFVSTIGPILYFIFGRKSQ